MVGNRVNALPDACYDDIWIVEPGRFEILVGPSSTDIRLKGHVEVVEE